MFWNESLFRKPANPFAVLQCLPSTLAPFWTSRLTGLELRYEPPVNVWHGPDAMLVALEAPGVRGTDLEIRLEGKHLIVQQRRSAQPESPAGSEPATAPADAPPAPSATPAAATSAAPTTPSPTPPEPPALEALREERHAGEFTRTIALPYHVESAQVTAQIEKGILWIKLPRALAERPRRIPVGTANA